MQSVAREYIKRGDSVDIKTFKLQYPEFLFPGKSQTLDTEPPADLEITRCVNTVNPFNWISVGFKIRRERPDILFLKYWTPFMAPCFGTIAYLARGNRHTKVICQIDNVEPHEHHIIDKPFNKYFLNSVDGCIYMSDQVGNVLREYTDAESLFSPHPMFENLGERIPKEQACEALGLDVRDDYALFFGLIRDYKGLDMLLEAWARMRDAGATNGRKLIVAGEFYTSRDKYVDMIRVFGIEDDVILHDHFIDDKDVANYFSLSDFIVLPYHTATQSGVTQIAYNFCTPMIVTRVGGLPEIVPHDRVGFVCEPMVDGVEQAMMMIWTSGTVKRFSENIVEERKRFSWAAMCDRITELYKMLID